MAKATKRVSASAEASNRLFVYVFGALIVAFATGQAVILLLQTQLSARQGSRSGSGSLGFSNVLGLPSGKGSHPSLDSLVDITKSTLQLRGNVGAGASSDAVVYYADSLDIHKPLPALSEPWPFEDLQEAPYPTVQSKELQETVLLSTVNARAGREAAGGAVGKQADGGGEENKQPVTVGSPCWDHVGTLLQLGLDAMGEKAAGDDFLPTDVRRSRVPVWGSKTWAQTTCAFASAPTGGGLQCCCEGAVPGLQGEPDADRGLQFFCMPGLYLFGVRHGGLGQLWAHLQQHGYLRSSPGAPLDHAFGHVRSPRAIDMVGPKLMSGMYAAARAMTTAGDLDTAAAEPEGEGAGDAALHGGEGAGALQASKAAAGMSKSRVKAMRKAVGNVFFSSADPSGLHSISSIPSLKSSWPRTRVVVQLRDPIPRAYWDLARTLVEEVGGAVEGSAGEGPALAGAARNELLGVLHACARRVTCAAGGEDSLPTGAEGTKALEQCIADTLTASLGTPSAPVSSLARALEAYGQDSAQGGIGPVSACLASSMAGGGVADWGQAYKRWVALGRAPSTRLLSCPGRDPTLPLDSSWQQEAVQGVWSPTSLPHGAVRQMLGCVPAKVRGYSQAGMSAWPGQLAWQPSEESMLAAIRAAQAELAPCTVSLLPGHSAPMLPDLLARVSAGYHTAMGTISFVMPDSSPAPGAVLLDGGEAGKGGAVCFPEGTDGPGLGAALARSMYLRGLQRVHASDGPSPALIFDAAGLQTGSAHEDSLKVIYQALNVYVPGWDVAAAQAWATQHVRDGSAAWRGEEGELYLEEEGAGAEGIPPSVRDALEQALDPHMRALAAYAGLPQPPAGERVEWSSLVAALAGKGRPAH